MTADIDNATELFVGYRELLFSVVYNMLGSVADTEDVLQEVWLAWQSRSVGSSEPVDNPRAYLTRMAVNQALARRATLSRRREDYVGQWLPEPLLDGEPDGATTVERTEAFSMAMLVVLESLTPLERAVFVLNEVFAYPHTEIAEMVDRSPAAVRQIAHRARAHVRARRPRTQVDPRVCRAVTERFVAAAMGGDLEELLAILSPEVTLWTDGGGTGPATSLRPVHGQTAVAAVFMAVAAAGLDGYRVGWRTVSGDPCAVVFDGDAPLAVVVLDVATDDTVIGIYSVTNPEKLTHLHKLTR
ncbi:RNA polymerase sigma factor SigJ [Nocardia sp. GTS18]|uniref:RNA polymerase sigma factor SigJ n=1 Tax=Nocardia sp. GTS18 TaxID=1778064 RepID=UPI0015EF9CE6|nr:RNA polymerase sigma factor SigJ [Nocardia sp. GTS18]